MKSAGKRKIRLLSLLFLALFGLGMANPPALPYDPGMTDYTGWVTANGDTYYLRDGSPLTGLRLVEGQYCFFDAHGIKARAVGVDVSTYSEGIDWALAKAQGIDFAVIRVGGRGWTSGSVYGDVRAQTYLRDSQKAGIKRGVYFYSTAVNEHEAVEEAEAVLRVLGGRALELPVYCDLEFSGEYPEGRADRLNAGERTQIALAFCRKIESAGYRAGVYSGQYYFQHHLIGSALRRYQLWLAAYTADGMPPDFAGRCGLWQFTDRGSVSGMRCGTDMNVMF